MDMNMNMNMNIDRNSNSISITELDKNTVKIGIRKYQRKPNIHDNNNTGANTNTVK